MLSSKTENVTGKKINFRSPMKKNKACDIHSAFSKAPSATHTQLSWWCTRKRGGGTDWHIGLLFVMGSKQLTPKVSVSSFFLCYGYADMTVTRRDSLTLRLASAVFRSRYYPAVRKPEEAVSNEKRFYCNPGRALNQPHKLHQIGINNLKILQQ